MNKSVFYFLISSGVAFISGFGISHHLDHQDKTIDRSKVLSASELIDLSFTQSEIDSMIPGLEENIKFYQGLHKDPLDYSVSPSLVFNPMPVGFELSNRQVEPVFREFSDLDVPQNFEELAFYSIPELACLLREQKLSSVALTKFFLDRLRKYDDSLHCVISYTEELAMSQARRADLEISRGIYKGPLHGIPYGVKDLFSVPGYKTTWGAAPFRDQYLEQEAAVVQKLRESGAVLIAKLSMGALAMGDVWYGEKTRNPWDIQTGSSGSSAGSAAAVSAGLLPFAIGTETLGSIVAPASICGVTGLRPTFGRVSRYGAMALSWSLDKIGPIARSVEDCAIVFNVIRGEDEKDPSITQADFNYNSSMDFRKLKLGYLKSVFDSDYNCRSTDSLTIAFFREQGFSLIPVELPVLPDIVSILDVEAATAFDELTRNNRDDLLVRQGKNAWPNIFRTARFIPAVEYLRANQYRSLLIEKMDSIFKEVDLFITPSLEGPSLKLTNLTGHPEIVVPNGNINGKPVSISFVGGLFKEADLLGLAKFYQEMTNHHKKYPENFLQN